MVDPVGRVSFYQPLGETPSPTATGPSRAPVADGVARMLNAIPEPGGDPAAAQAGKRKLVAKEDSVDAGGAHDAYDLKLYREPDGKYTLELDMGVELTFEKGPNGEVFRE
jgi:hypothetical protein